MSQLNKDIQKNESSIHGQGLFATQDYKKGDVICKDFENVYMSIREFYASRTIIYDHFVGLNLDILSGMYWIMNKTLPKWIDELEPSDCKNNTVVQKYIAEMKQYRKILSKDGQMKRELKKHTDEYLAHLFIRIQTNYFQAGFLINGIDHPHTILFRNTSKLNHSCNANCTNDVLSEGNDLTTLKFYNQIKAIQPIKKGEEITISYLSDIQLMCSIDMRHKILLEKFNFVCKCSRCSQEKRIN